MALTTVAKVKGTFYVLGLTYKIAMYERMAITHAHSLQHYGGSYMDPYSTSGEFPGDLSVKLLNRAYMMFAQNARNHFITTVYYYFPRSPFTSVNTSITLPLGPLRVLRSVNVGEASSVELSYKIELPITDFKEETCTGKVSFPQQISASVKSGSVKVGDTLVQVDAMPYQTAPAPKVTFTKVTDQSRFKVDNTTGPFCHFPSWRIIPPSWDGIKATVGTQATTVLEVSPELKLADPVEDFMARILAGPQISKTEGNTVVLNVTTYEEDGKTLIAEGAGIFDQYIADYTGYYDEARSNEKYSKFFSIAGPMSSYPGYKATLTGGCLTLYAPKDESLPSSFVIAVSGETEFRPAITLDKYEPNQEGIRVDPGKETVWDLPGLSSLPPSADRLAPQLLYPVPSFEHAAFLEKFHAGVGQAIFVTHLSPDDSRYAGEKEMLERFIKAMTLESDRMFRKEAEYAADAAPELFNTGGNF